MYGTNHTPNSSLVSLVWISERPCYIKDNLQKLLMRTIFLGVVVGFSEIAISYYVLIFLWQSEHEKVHPAVPSLPDWCILLKNIYNTNRNIQLQFFFFSFFSFKIFNEIFTFISEKHKYQYLILASLILVASYINSDSHFSTIQLKFMNECNTILRVI